ncbi:MAG: NAD(P)-dependent alcohol dehydrogenase [Bacteroidetes bacterium]|nr:MAG: NAD(P)-dependent alcohol dehydrogenase [Bacteroidota bacterium]
MVINGWAAREPGGKLEPYQYELGALGPDEVDIEVRYCGLCHSDLSMIKNDWRFTKYPFVPGHEIVGTIIAKGDQVRHLEIGQAVGVGWNAHSCQTCADCMSGNHNLCDQAGGTIVGRHGGFADKVRAQAVWAIPIPDGVDLASAGPLFCGGVTVFNPLVQNHISPLHSVGVVGIGGLGHMALAFLRAWGCEVTAFSTSPEKEAEARALGAHHFVSTHDLDALKKLRNHFDMILDTVNVELPWDAYLATLKSKGVLHIVGAASGVKARIGNLMGKQRSISASPTGSPAVMAEMLRFAARHKIRPKVEMFKMAEVNEALERLENGKPRYRIVLENEG